MSEPQPADVAVIGAGLGGLTCAALLARAGRKVQVFEQHFLAGGFCTSWERQLTHRGRRLRFVFDAGVHDVSGLGPRGAVRELLEGLGVMDRLRFLRTRHEHAIPGLRFRMPDGPEAIVSGLSALFPDQAAGLAAFFAEMRAAHEAISADRQHRRPARWMSAPFQSMLRTFVKHPQLREILGRLARYRTDEADELSVAEMAPIYGYLIDGGFYPEGGSQTLADALVHAILRDGGQVRLSAPVRQLRVEGGRAAGVHLRSGEEVRARQVVFNGDLLRLPELAPPGALPPEYRQRLSRLRPSTSALEVFLGLDVVPELADVTFFRPEDGPALSVWVPSRIDPSLATPGCAGMTLIAHVPREEARTWDRRHPDYPARKRAAADALLASAARLWPPLLSHVVHREDATPATFARYAWTTGGAIYGVASGGLRPPVRTPLPGLALAGSATLPGPGVEGVMISGRWAAEAVLADLGAG